MAPITVALDWTPNTNHSGFYLAKQKGLYAAAGLDVTLLSPHVDGYKATPASRLEGGNCTFAIVPKETLLSFHTTPGRPALVCVAAVLQRDTSAIVTLKSSGRARPRDLEGCTYASYGARYEGRIVQRLIQADGGAGEYREEVLPMLDIWPAMLAGRADATWVFMGWEGVEAERAGTELNAFYLRDSGIPYGYAPVLAVHPDTLQQDPASVRAFLRATAEGFAAAAADPAAAAAALVELGTAENPGLPKVLDPAMVRASQEVVGRDYLPTDGGGWGRMEADRWGEYVDWMFAEGLVTTLRQSRAPVAGESASLDDLRAGRGGDQLPRAAVDCAALFTNDYLP